MDQKLIRQLVKVGGDYIDASGKIYRFFWTSNIYRKEIVCAEYIQTISLKRHKVRWYPASYKLIQSIIRKSKLMEKTK